MTELFALRVRTTRDAPPPPSLDAPLPPWRLLETQGYPQVQALREETPGSAIS